MSPNTRLDARFRWEQLTLTLGLLILPVIWMLLSTRYEEMQAATVPVMAIFALTGMAFIHQFGSPGAPLSLGFLAVVTVVCLIGRSVESIILIGSGFVVTMGTVIGYGVWFKSMQVKRDHVQSAETQMSSSVLLARQDVEKLEFNMSQQKRRLETWASLVGAVRNCSSTLKSEDLATATLETLARLFPGDRPSLWIGSLEPPPPSDSEVAYGTDPSRAMGRRYQLKTFEPLTPDGLDRLCWAEQRNINVTSQEEDYRFQGNSEYRFSGSSALVCPLKSDEGICGHLRVTSPVPYHFAHEDMLILNQISAVISMALSNVWLFERMESLALTDGLTGMFKRYHFEKRYNEECKRSRRNGTPIALIIFDIDHFKRINDTYGHPVGDKVLARAGQIIREVDWGAPLPCRWGGEEFLLAMPDATMEHAMNRVDGIIRKLKAEVFTAGDAKFSVTVSAGVGVFPGDTGDPERLFQICDRRLYAAKNAGRDRIVNHD